MKKAEQTAMKRFTPLSIIAAFLTFTEVTLGIAITKTSGDIQVSLVVFFILFPLLVAGGFFIVLWNRPYVFYPPSEYGGETGVATYVEAMQKRPSQIISAAQEGVKESVHFEQVNVKVLRYYREIPSSKTQPTKGIQLGDTDFNNPDTPPSLRLTIHFKRSQYFGLNDPSGNEKWIFLEGQLLSTFSLRIQVRAWNIRDVDEFMNVLRNARTSWNLQGFRPNKDHAGDYLYVLRENEENRLVMSTFTATNAAVSMYAMFSDEVADALAAYFDEVGFVDE